MSFDWLSFLNANGINYVEHGPNVQRGRVAIKCPLCGSADPSEHMGIIVDHTHPHYPAWGCLRNDRHRGKSPHYLVHLLTGWSKEQTNDYVGGGGSPQSSWKDLRDRFRKYDEKSVETPELLPDPVELLPEFSRIKSHGLTSRFWRYLYEARGFRREDVRAVIRSYRLRCALMGRFAGRLIVPFYREGECYGWSGRDITGRSEIRYRSHPEGDNVKRSVFNYDHARIGGDILAICEGPFDTLKLDFYGQHAGLRAVGLLGTSASEGQARDIYTLAREFSRMVLVLDTDARSQAHKIKSALADLGLRLGRLPVGTKDPGEMTRKQVREFVGRLRSL